jgi:hypothetical protein
MDIAPILALLATVLTAVAALGGALLLIWGTKLAYAKLGGK